MYSNLIIFSVLVSAAWGGVLDFPPGFKFGSGTASYQVEGAWNVSDKGESIWDRFTHENPDVYKDGNGDVACDSYHLWREDVQLVVNLGLHYYRFSISWPRLLPTGFANKISEDGARYYNDLIDELVKNGIEPMVTLYHWDLPQAIQDLGGWVNPLIVDWFADYSKVVFSLYGDRVKTWLTFNEPLAMCDYAYNALAYAPGLVDPDRSAYLCDKNLLMAHASAWRIYDEEFKPKYQGKVSIANHLVWIEPESPDEMEILEISTEYLNYRYVDPIFSKEGGWPPQLEEAIAENSREQGYTRSRLPAFTEQQKEFVRGTYDFFGFNHYTSRLVRRAKPGEVVMPSPAYGIPELGVVLEISPDWDATFTPLMPINPESVRRLLFSLKERYGDMDFLITENGFGSTDDTLDDNARIDHIHAFLEQILLSIHEDQVNVIGYTAWSLMDVFEWDSGYNTGFGLHRVNFSDPMRERTARKSASYYSSVIKHHSLDVPAL